MASQLHFILIPFMSQSHIIPLMDLAKVLVQRDLIITIVTTPVNAISIQAIIDRAQKTTNVKISVATVPFPSQEAGLPEGCESMDTLTSPDMAEKLVVGSSILQEPIQNLLRELQPRPSCIISSNALPWTTKVASNLKIPRYEFQSVSCFASHVAYNCGPAGLNTAETINSDTEPFVVPNMPDEIVLTKSQLAEHQQTTRGEVGNNFINQMIEAFRLTRGNVVHSFEEMEPKYVEAQKNLGKRIWCIGPLSLCNKEMSDKSERGGNKASIDENLCLKWLDSMAPSSVIYACFGSISRMSSSQMIEIGLGLEASNRPFIWIIKKKDISRQVEKWFEEEKFEERVKGRGLIIRGWAPQVLILSHPSVGGFITHCGWNSTLEAVCAGLPMITWPMLAEQFYNEKLIVNVLKIGVRVGVELAIRTGDEELDKVYVRREQVKGAIEQLMDEEEKYERLKRAKELSQMATKATEEGGSSYLNLTSLIQDVIEQLKLQE